MLVGGVERDFDNADTARTLARELAFGLAQRGRSASDLSTFLRQASLRGVAVPPIVVARLTGGVADADIEAWLRAEGVATIVFLEVAIHEQVWASAASARASASPRAAARSIRARRPGAPPRRPKSRTSRARASRSRRRRHWARWSGGEPEPAALPRPSSLIANLRLRW